jgi:dTDP-glucose 4,6-dehydratase
MKMLITGGSGFIGSALVRMLLDRDIAEVVNVDKLTYAASQDSLLQVAQRRDYHFEHADVCDLGAMQALLEHHRPEVIVHLAAESHVDRSIDGPAEFIQTNILGTYTMLEACLGYYRALPSSRQDRFRFLHVSTDEVFGALGPTGKFHPDTPYDPRSPYSASKASSDHLARAWFHTYGLPVIVSNCSNNYGPYQFPEKMIPLMITNGLRGLQLPVYGKGENIRDWLHVEDHAAALIAMVQGGTVGDTYLVGGEEEHTNMEVVGLICELLDDRLPGANDKPYLQLVTFVEDRPGHDLRYAIDPSRLQDELGWRPSVTFAVGLAETVDWYIANEWWWQPLVAGSRGDQRLGLARTNEVPPT